MTIELLNASAAARILRDGGVIAAPSESVYGLSCDPANESAVRRILAIKGRSAEAGLILIGASSSQFHGYVDDVADEQQARALGSWPGPVTWLFPRSADVPDWLAGSHPCIALRIPDHAPSRELCQAFGSAVVSTSANRSGQPPLMTAKEVAAEFGTEIDGILEGELGGRAQPSEIRDLATGQVLREG